MVYNYKKINIILLPTAKKSFPKFHSWAMPDKSVTSGTGLTPPAEKESDSARLRLLPPSGAAVGGCCCLKVPPP
jgi:hypothetical protein